MKHVARAAVLMLAGLVAIGPLARAGVPRGSGGHGGPGGHGSGGHGFSGHGGGRSSAGRSSGHASGGGVGHAIGRPFGHLFGHHSKAPGSGHDVEPPPAGAAFVHGKVVQLSGPRPVSFPARRRFHHHPINDFPFGDRFLLFPHRFGFGFGEFDGCGPFDFPRHRFFFNDGIDCFGGGFFFDPFFIDAFSESFIGGPGFWEGRIGNGAGDSTAAPGAEENLGPQSSAAILTESGSDTGNGAANNAQPGRKAKSEPTVSLLQLRDGSMYGLTQYWVEGGQLHYVTTYGGQDSIALDRIDLEATMKLNSERGVEFVLKPKTNPQ